MKEQINLKTAPIGFFDSGIGGLTVLNKVQKILPNENYMYFGDLAHIPYGEKTKEQLIQYADEIFNFFEKKGVKAVVMACNTTSAATYETLKNKYNFKIYPIIQSCASVIAKMDIKKIGVLATAVTINSKAYSKELKKHNPSLEVFEEACPMWVNIVENKLQDEEKSLQIIKDDLEKMLKNSPEKIILGCTHYPYLIKTLSKFTDSDIFIDPSTSFADLIKSDLETNSLLNDSKSKGLTQFFVSANPEHFKFASSLFYNLEELPQEVKL